MKRFSLALLGAVGAFFVLTPAQAADYRVIQWNDTKICQVVDMAGLVQANSVELYGADEKIAADLRRRGEGKGRRRREGQVHALEPSSRRPSMTPPHHPGW